MLFSRFGLFCFAFLCNPFYVGSLIPTGEERTELLRNIVFSYKYFTIIRRTDYKPHFQVLETFYSLSIYKRHLIINHTL